MRHLLPVFMERNVIFMKSENLPAFFVLTESGSMDWLHENKENEEQGIYRA
jgi:hypothetical protein